MTNNNKSNKLTKKKKISIYNKECARFISVTKTWRKIEIISEYLFYYFVILKTQKLKICLCQIVDQFFFQKC